MDADERARELIEERTAGSRCSVCDARDWEVAKDGRPITFLSFEAKDDPRVRVLGIACRNCGYLRFHALEAVS